MTYRTFPHPSYEIVYATAEFVFEAAREMAKNAHAAYRFRHRVRRGSTLRPGKRTPLWNELRRQLRPHLRKWGRQAHLGRMLGLPRQRINAFITRGREMPDAERTLQLLAWLMAATIQYGAKTSAARRELSRNA